MIWLIGCNGMLGKELSLQLTQSKISWVGSDSDIDITDARALENFINTTETASYYSVPDSKKQDGKITWIINCAAYTAVDKAEDEAEKARAINVDGVVNIARTARNHGAKLIHISTDYVFDGNADVPYVETEQKNPLGIYGKTKSESEDAVAQAMTQYYIVRTSWLYGFDGRNFVYTMTHAMNARDEVTVVNDQRGSPTFCGDLALAIITLIEKSQSASHLFGKNSPAPYGIYHFANEGETTWFEFAKAIYELGKKYKRILHDCTVTPCATNAYPTKAVRPRYSVLSKAKIEKELKIRIPQWQQSLERFMKSERFAVPSAMQTGVGSTPSEN